MKRLVLLAALTGILSFAPMASLTVAHAEEGYSEMDNGAGMSEEGQWLADEPATMEGGEAIEPMEDGSGDVEIQSEEFAPEDTLTEEESH